MSIKAGADRAGHPTSPFPFLRYYLKGPLKNDFTELAPRFASDSVATD